MRNVKGWDRGLVDGDYTADDAEGWQRWAEGIVDRYPEATLAQLIALTSTGSFDGDYYPESEVE